MSSKRKSRIEISRIEIAPIEIRRRATKLRVVSMLIALGVSWLTIGLECGVADEPTGRSPAKAVAFPKSLSSAMRDYRIEVYRAFRQDRLEFNRRQLAAEDTIARWRDSEKLNPAQSTENLKKITDWFVQSSKSLQEGERSEAPHAPLFGDRTALEERTAQNRPKPDDSLKTPLPSSDLLPTGPTTVAPEPEVSLPKEHRATVVPKRAESVVPPASADGNPAVVARHLAEPTRSAPEPNLPSPVDLPIANDIDGGKRNLKDTPNAAVQINLNELSARIRGWNLKLKQIEGRVISSSTPSMEELTETADQLRALLARRASVQVYLSVLSPQQRARVGELDSYSPTLELVLSQLKEAQQRYTKRASDAGESLSDGSPATERIERLRLDLENVSK